MNAAREKWAELVTAAFGLTNLVNQGAAKDIIGAAENALAQSAMAFTFAFQEEAMAPKKRRTRRGK